MSTKSCRHLGFGKKEIVLATSGHENHEIMADLLQLDGFLDKKRHPPCQSDSATNSCNKAGFFPMW